MARTSSEVWEAMREICCNLSKRRRNCNQVGSGKSNVSWHRESCPHALRLPDTTPVDDHTATAPGLSLRLPQHEVFEREIVCIIDNEEFGAVLVQVSRSRLGLRVLQCPRIGRPSAAKNWSPSACSSSLFLGATTARTDRPPARFCRSRILMVLPAPGSATITCQLRLSQEWWSIFWSRLAKAVSTNISHLEKRMSHERYSSRIMRTGKRGTGRSGSASGTGSASVTTCVISAETAA